MNTIDISLFNATQRPDPEESGMYVIDITYKGETFPPVPIMLVEYEDMLDGKVKATLHDEEFTDQYDFFGTQEEASQWALNESAETAYLILDALEGEF